jgi:drug/metabolite transporter (DMT)-like permease
LGLIASISWGGGDFLGGIFSRRLPSAVVLFWGQLAGGTCVLIIALLTDARLMLDGLIWGALGGLAGLLGLMALYQGLARGVMAIVSPLSACGAIVPLGVALARGTLPDSLALLGMALAFCGAILATLTPTHGDGLSKTLRASSKRSGAIYGIVAALGFGFFFVTLAQGTATGTSSLWVIVGARACTVPLLGIFCLVTRLPMLLRGLEIPGVTASGLLDTTANLGFALASTMGNLALVSILASLYPVTTILLALAILKEWLTPWQTAGVLLALMGIGFMAAN